MSEKFSNIPPDFNPARRKFLRDAGAAGAAFVLTSIPGVDALASAFEQKPSIAAEILLFFNEMKKGGRYREAISGRVASEPILKEMLESMDRIAGGLRSMHFGKKIADKETGKYVISQELPGLGQLKVDTGKRQVIDGRAAPIFSLCNGFFLHGGGKTRFITADHCLPKGSAMRSEFESFDAMGIDLARRDVSNEYKGAALTFDGHTSRDDVSGTLGVTVGEKDGIADAFYSPLIPMTDAVYHELFIKTRIPVPPGMERHIREGMWKVFPRSQGVVFDGQLAAQGRSGSIEIAYEPRRRGYTPAGVFFAVCTPRTGVFKDRVIAFVSSPDSLSAAVNSNAGKFARPVSKL